jgi:hypothetical protein
MIAITITQQLKNLNKDLFKNDLVGQIKKLTVIPKSFYSINYNIGQRTDGYHTLDNSIHESDGFFDYVEPVYSALTQKLGDIYFNVNVNVFTNPVINLTQAEIDAIGVKVAKDEFKNNLTGVFAYATTPDGTKEYAIKIGNDGKIVTVLVT